MCYGADMRFLYVGDVVGALGCAAVHALIPRLRKKLRVDAVIVNCENAADGLGVTPELADAFLARGVDVLTSGNHIWQHRQIEAYLEAQPRLIRPANYPSSPGRGAYRLKLADGRVLGVVQVEGRVFMRKLACPFETARREIDRLGSVDAIFVDIHAEATSEKQALAWYLDGLVSAVIGTHTHVPTADERILPGGTALLTDVGMTGPFDSVIGMAVEPAIARFLTQRRTPHEVATDNVWLCGAVVETDAASKKAVSIERVREMWHPKPRLRT